MGAKSHYFIITAILVSAVMFCWCAEAAPNFGKKQIVKRVITHYERHSYGIGSWMECVAYNTSTSWLCAVYDVYPAWVSNFPKPVHATVYSMLPAKTYTQVYAVAFNVFQQQPLQCRLKKTLYRRPLSFCP
jgi:hypothetical protein